MVLVNLSKLIGFISIIHKTSKEVSRRKTRLIKAYNKLVADTANVVSIKMNFSLERWKKEILQSRPHLARILALTASRTEHYLGEHDYQKTTSEM